MQSEVLVENKDGNVRVMAVEFGQEESYRIYIGFWRRLKQTVMKTSLFIARKGNGSIFQRHPAVLAICRK